MTCVFDTFFETLWPLWASTYKGEEYFHHLWQLRWVVATIQRRDGRIWDDLGRTMQFETIYNEFGTFEMSFDSFRTIDGRFVVAEDDWEWWVDVQGQITFILESYTRNSGRFEAFMARFEQLETNLWCVWLSCSICDEFWDDWKFNCNHIATIISWNIIVHGSFSGDWGKNGDFELICSNLCLVEVSW